MKNGLYQPEGTLFAAPEVLGSLASRAGLERAMEKGTMLEAAPYLCDHDMNLHFSFDSHIHGIMKKEDVLWQDDGDEIKDIAVLTRVGKPVVFRVTGLEKSGGELLARLSRRAVQKECAENYIASLRPGDLIPARVTHLENFGAFLDVGCGIPALLSIDCISVSRISHPRERLKVGETIYVLVKEIDEKGRIYVTTRELLGTWEENAALFSEGQTVRGIVRSVEDYGIFVELKPNLAGLAEYRDGVDVGDTAAVYIKSILPDKMKVKLIIIDAQRVRRDETPLPYFIDPFVTDSVKAWRYSPPTAGRVLETVF